VFAQALGGGVVRVEVAAWRSAMIMIAATVEAAILAAVEKLEPALRRDGYWPKGDTSPATWSFGTLVDVASRAGWLSSVTSGGAGYDLTAAIPLVGDVRNLAIHPGRYARSSSAPDFSDVAMMRRVFELLDRIALAVLDNIGLAARLEQRRHRDA
jgi:hypothetical protein